MASPLVLLPNALAQQQANPVFGVVSSSQPAPSRFTDPLYVEIPDWSSDFYVTISTWPQVHGMTLPAAGASVTLSRDSRGDWTCVWWDGPTQTGALGYAQDGVIDSADAQLTSLTINTTTGALTPTFFSALPMIVNGGVIQFAGGTFPLGNHVPVPGDYAVVGIEVSPAGLVSSVKAADTATQLNTGVKIAANTSSPSSGRVRLADVAVWNNAGVFGFGDHTTVATQGVNWIDRRPWARGAHSVQTLTNVANYTTSSTTYVAIDLVNLIARVECSGAPLRIRLLGIVQVDVNVAPAYFNIFMDAGVELAMEQQLSTGSGATLGPVLVEGEFIPTTGSHLFAPTWHVRPPGPGFHQLITSDPNDSVALIIEEIVRQTADNGTV